MLRQFRSRRTTLTLCLAVILFSSTQTRAQSQTLVVEGGTLVDGTGSNPVRNAVVVIEGNKIKAVGPKPLPQPAGAGE